MMAGERIRNSSRPVQVFVTSAIHSVLGRLGLGVAIVIGSVLVSMPSLVFADRIAVTVAGPGVSGVTVVDPLRPQNSIDFFANTAGYPPTSVSVGTGITDSTGRAFFAPRSPLTRADSLSILIGSSSTQHFNIVATPGTSHFQSNEELFGGFSFLRNTGTLPFTVRPFVFTDAGSVYAQFSITNTSTQFGYDLTALKLYTDVGGAFFHDNTFNLPAAVATGTLAHDYIAENGGRLAIPVSGQGVSSQIVFSAPYSSRSGYELLIGTARPIFPDGTFGAPQDFSIAAVPEPTSAMLFGGGVLVLLVSLSLRMRRARNLAWQKSYGSSADR